MTAPAPALATIYTRYATYVEPTADWVDESYAEGSGGGCNSTGCCATNPTTASTDFMEAREFGTFTIPAGEHITRVAVNVFTRYNTSTTGCRVRLRVRHGTVPDTATNSPTWSQGSSTSCRWAFSGDGWDITNLLPSWTEAIVNDLWVSVRRYPTNSSSTTCRVNAYRIVVETAPDPPVCSVSPTSIEFGTHAENSITRGYFNVRNVGYGTLSVSINSQNPSVFPVLSGQGSHSLVHDESVEVEVGFIPPAAGSYSTTITTGCTQNVAVHGTGDSIGACCEPYGCVRIREEDCGWAYGGDGSGCSYCPTCGVSASNLQFGYVSVGSTAHRQFTISNNGGSVLAGTMGYADGPEFTVVGVTDYAIPPGGSEVYDVYFQPNAEQDYSDFVDFFCPPDPHGISFQGSGAVNESRTDLKVLDFGVVPEGDASDLQIVVQNDGQGWTGGYASTTCSRFSIVGDAELDLPPGGSRVVGVRFTPGTTDSIAGELVLDLSGGAQVLRALLVGAGEQVTESPIEISGDAVRTGVRSCTPNPFDDGTRVDYELADAGRVSIQVVDVGGRRVTTLVDEVVPRGRATVLWDGTTDTGSQAASGIYFVRFISEHHTETRRLLRIR